ncbi:alkylated dna repair protein alkb like 6 [Fusarium flagelliforme]|uniref:Alkylated dna repair protein alkb like 6 n=1 Tax=Fusarium flagelliforme TaxID=2675880 RepID=A0A395MWA2_9HYPO|nr:alkylated dna repair protein alkb like 6 [Fusarium flagelliforme]
MEASESVSSGRDRSSLLLPSSLEHARITSLPQAAYYIPNFITEEEEKIILDKISSAPKPRWKQLTKRRLQTWPSDLVNNKLLDAPLPTWLQDPVMSRLLSLPVKDSEAGHLFCDSPHQKPNHVLINEYPPGIGIMPHKLSTQQDGAAYWPVVCTVSLGSSLCLNLHRSKDDGALDPVPAWRILQEPRSLLITTDQLYTDYLHGIADIEEDVDLNPNTVANWDLLRSPDAYANGTHVREIRTSLTYRDVLQVSKVANKFGMFLKR